MPLGKPVTRLTTELDDYEIEEVPEGIPRDRWKRPLITPAGGGPPIGYTRASTLGKAIEDTYHLNQWTVRAVVLGMSRREELVARAAAIPENEGDYRTELQQIGAEAKTAGGGDKGANIGTALHKLAERADAGDDLSYLPGVLADAIEAYLKFMDLFEVLASETFVVCDVLQAGGSFDRVVRLKVELIFHHAELGSVILPAGTVLVLDLKTGKLESAKYWGPTYGVQQTVYACGQPYWPGRSADGRYSWEELCGAVPSDRWALILHVPGDSPKDAGLVVVDLEDGRAMSDLALDNRRARKSKTLLTDCFPVPIDDPTTAEDAEDEVITSVSNFEAANEAVEDPKRELVEKLLDAILHAETEAKLEELYDAAGEVWLDLHTAAVQARLAELKAASRPAQVVHLDLMALLRQAADEAELTALWEIHQAEWTDRHTAMAKARSRELRSEVPA